MPWLASTAAEQAASCLDSNFEQAPCAYSVERRKGERTWTCLNNSQGRQSQGSTRMLPDISTWLIMQYRSCAGCASAQSTMLTDSLTWCTTTCAPVLLAGGATLRMPATGHMVSIEQVACTAQIVHPVRAEVHAAPRPQKPQSQHACSVAEHLTFREQFTTKICQPLQALNDESRTSSTAAHLAAAERR